MRRLASYLSRVESVESNGSILEDPDLCVTGVFIFARDTSDDQIRSRDWQTSTIILSPVCIDIVVN